MMTVGPLATRRLLFALPALTVAVVIAALLGPAKERGVRAARVYGGPISGAPRPTFRLELLESREGVDRLTGSPHIDVLLRTPAGHEAVWSGAVPPSGVVDVALPALPLSATSELLVIEGEREIARGSFSGKIEDWSRAATRRGGLFSPKHPPGLALRIGVERGVLAVPFPGALVLSLERLGAGSVEGVEIELGADGAELEARRVVTDRAGRARVGITPRTHSVAVRVRAASEKETLETTVNLPVVAGAIDARRAGDKLRVTSPVPRAQAFVTLVTEHYRLFGASLDLLPDADGGASAEVALPALPNEPVWAVTSSAVDLESPARVGWPLDVAPNEARRTFDVAERLLVDGQPLALRREQARKRRVRWTVVALCVLSLSASLALLARTSARAGVELERHFEASGLPRGGVPARRGDALVAVVVVALAFALLAAFAFLAEP
jgi:hypothetical protein